MYKIRFSAILAFCLLAPAAQAQNQADWIEDTLSEQCSAESIALVTAGTRAAIEQSVARAEASIRSPASTADLSCLDDLINSGLDIFSDSFGLVNDIINGLSAGLDFQTLSSGIQQAICGFSQQKFNEVTKGLTGSMADITGALSLPSYSDRYGLINISLDKNKRQNNNPDRVEIRTNPLNTKVKTPTINIPDVNIGSQIDLDQLNPDTPQSAPVVSQPKSRTEIQIENIWNNLNGNNGANK